MSKKEKIKKPKKHRLLKHPILGWIIWTLAIFVISESIGTLFEIFSGAVSYTNTWRTFFGASIIALLLLLFFKKRYSPEFKGFVKCGDHKNAWIFICPTVIFILFNVYDCISGSFYMPNISSFGMATMAGVCEEAAFRAAPIAFMFCAWKFNEKRIIPVLVLSSLAFAVVHAANIFSGAAVNITIIQVLYCIAIGLIYGAVFIRTGDIIPAMVAHFLTDIFAFSTEETATGVITKTTIGIEEFIIMVASVIISIFAIYLVRPSKHAEISALWKKKWSITDNQE